MSVPATDVQSWLLRQLDPGRPYKPLDVGEDGLAACVDDQGRFTAVTQAHRESGWVVLTAEGGLPSAARFDQGAVRRFRRRLASRSAATFGIEPPATDLPARRPRVAWLVQDVLPLTQAAPSAPRLLTVVPAADDAGGARGVVQASLDGNAMPGRWIGRVRLDRAELPELTEGRPLPAIGRRPRASIRGKVLVVDEPALPWAIAVAGDLVPVAACVLPDGRALLEANLSEPFSGVFLGVGRSADEAIDAAMALARTGAGPLVEAAIRRWRGRWTTVPDDIVVRRGLGYALACCAAPIGDAACLVTDHRLLPLAWTRDGYFVARALLDWWAAGGPVAALDVVRRHLRWLYEVAERPEGWWARSHLANGARKDPAFQLDQQLYPLVELADYIDATGDRSPLEAFREEIGRVLRAVRTRRASGAPLYASEENAADDPLELPYQFANHVLLVHALERLERLGLDAAAVLDPPDAVRDAVRSHLVVEGPHGRPMFGYAVDLRGRVARLHDANDVPTALAPAWGFCRADDPVWRGTMEFAFSTRNPSFYPGRYGGLGSAHTPGPWPLGYLQALLPGEACDAEAAGPPTRAVDRSAFWDGALPEAVHPKSGRPISRPWFAWPGALAASLRLPMPGDRRGRASRARRGRC